MTGIIIAIAVVAIIGLVCGLILTIASKVMDVAQDERIAQVRECLPGANCGACGFTGCDGYAKALVETEGTPTNLCTPGGADAARKIADALGVEFADVAKKVAYVHCHGDCSATQTKFNYEGIYTCIGAKMLFAGQWSCPHGCLGFGDCMNVCENDAIVLKGGVAHIDPEKCTGCGLCAKTCPNALISLFGDKKYVVVACNSSEKGALTRSECSNGCIGCKKCEKTCSYGAIAVENNLARIDYDKCVACGECVSACPVGCLKIADFSSKEKVTLNA